MLRLIEYVYEDADIASDDMARWTHSHKSKRMAMRSMVIPFESIEFAEPEGVRGES